jgi:flagellar hook-basal body complex protein FliE
MNNFFPLNNLSLGSNSMMGIAQGANKLPLNQNGVDPNEFASFYQDALKDVNSFDNFDDPNMLSGKVEATFNANSAINDEDRAMVDNLKSVLKNTKESENDTNKHSPDKAYQNITHAVKDSLNNLNSIDKQAEDYVKRYAAGEDIDVHTVMIASQKAGMSMQLALQLRNKIVQAYQEVSRISV